MGEQYRTVTISMEDGYLATEFVPPIHDKKLFEATSDAFSMHQVIRDPERYRKIKKVIYETGDPISFRRNVAKLQLDVEMNTAYTVNGGVIVLGAAATGKSVTVGQG